MLQIPTAEQQHNLLSIKSKSLKPTSKGYIYCYVNNLN